MIETNSDTRKEISRCSKIAILSTLFALFSILMLFLFIVASSHISVFFLLPSILLALVLGILSFVSIRRSGGRLKGKSFSIAGILISIALTVVISYGAIQLKAGLDTILCGERLYGLRQFLARYSESHESLYPAKDKWCDLLKKEGCPDIYFTCPLAKKGPCNYALNPDVSPNSPSDMVLLFESIPGWNQFGGYELSYLYNHKEPGVNVLFNGGSVKFIRPEELKKLKWKDKQ